MSENDEDKNSQVKVINLSEVLKLVSKEVEKENQSIIGKLNPYVSKASKNTVSLKKLYFRDTPELSDDMSVGVGFYFIDKTSAYTSNDIDFRPDYVIKLSKEDIFKSARKLGIPKEVVEYIFKDISEYISLSNMKSYMIASGLVDLACYEKIKQNPKIFEDISKIVATKSEELKNIIIERAKKKLEEVS